MTIKTTEKDIRKDLEANMVFRAGSGMTDFLIVVIVSIVLFFGAYYGIFPHTQFQDIQDKTYQLYDESRLFDEEYNRYEYDRNKYEEVITYFYTTNQYAIDKQKMAEFGEAKKASGLFMENEGSYVVRENADEEQVKSFYEDQYAKALTFFVNETEVRSLSIRGMSMLVLAAFIAFSICCVIFYLLVPLKSAGHQTAGQKMNNIRPVDYETLGELTKQQVLLRFLVYSIFYYYLPFMLGFMFSAGSLMFMIPIIAMIFNIVNKYHRGIQDVLSNSIMVDARQK